MSQAVSPVPIGKHKNLDLGLKPVIQTAGLTKRYSGTLALDSLDILIHQGEVYGYLGPNGSGKTTTIRLLLGLHRPTSGHATVFGLDPWSDPVSVHGRLAYVAGEPNFWPSLTGLETLDFLAHLHGGIDMEYRRTLIDRFDLDPDKKVRAYSKGNRQKIQLVAAFATRADLLILDEPTSGLDPLMEVAFRTTVHEAKERGQTIFLSSHILSEVEALCDRVGLLRLGRLVEEGTLQQLRHLSAVTVAVTFERLVSSFPTIPGVDIAESDGKAIRFHVKGAVAPLINALAEFPVLTLTTHEPSLEEIFLTQYQKGS